MPYNLILNSACNLSCDYCFAKEIVYGSKAEISMDNFERVLEFFLRSGRKEISLLGGEPTLHSGFLHLLDRLLKNGFKFTIKSNALWSEKTREALSQLPSQSVSYLLNINSPSFYTDRQWRTIRESISRVKDSRIVLSLNIDREDFEYDYILQLASDFCIKYFRWSFAHPIFEKNRKAIQQRYLPIQNYQFISSRIVGMVKAAGELGINTLGDHSVIMCMFDEAQLSRIYESGGELNSKCEGTLEIKPDLQVIYCLPMNSFFPAVYLEQFNSLDEIDLYFENRIKNFRVLSYPLQACTNCEYRKRDECHGGCLAHRDFSEDSLQQNLTTWTTRFLLDKRLVLSNDMEFEKAIDGNGPATYLVRQPSNGNSWSINSGTYELLHVFDGKRTLRELSGKMEESLGIKIDESEHELDSLFETSRTYGFLELV